MIISRNQIKKAGKILKNKEKFKLEEIEKAENILTYWRTIHGSVLDEFNEIVSNSVQKINPKSYVASRVKRSPTIIGKLKRKPDTNTQLTTMYDIAGIRAIMKNLTEVEKLSEVLKKVAQKHEFKDYNNYITNPKKSGYRSVHLIYKYKNTEDLEINNLFIEIQIRTELQHSWGTAVETMSTFLGTNLKFGEGQPKWLKYFALTSSAFSFLEGTPQVPSYKNLDKKETFRQAIYEFNYNQIEQNLSAFSVAAKAITSRRKQDDFFHLLKLDISNRLVNITSFPKEEFEKANEKYTLLERKYSKKVQFEIVLVSTESVKELQSAFPNYFLDTGEFLNNMERIKVEYNKLK
jgi:ppGpp synthetase/RelA/SpoT-type nucleotidyltranferase